ncbi:Hypothetical protein R9X50_00163100 [Acrodontium crateriforme]|uniref:Zn(2)-C6 fungal-type domain-containing protein n=1 Tax=Acrodontium crateriforme TaxID=150365 RepID=A0AAQ3LZD8_9PEZI|nr:Hypothetical protein R9X50_00163100 [Acrodontium crateriforme]
MAAEPPQQSEESASTSAPANDSTESASSAPKPLRRACDCCRKRKVKCDGADPCGPCKKASIRCAYLQPPKKKGPKGLRSARVLHALRRIDDTATGSPASSLSPDQQARFGDWGWNPSNTSPTGMVYHDPSTHPANTYYGQQAMPSENGYFHQQQIHSAMRHHPQGIPQAPNQPQFGPEAPHQHWAHHHHPESSAGSDHHQVTSPSNSDAAQHRLPAESFPPYVQLFFAHMFPIMPVFDRRVYLDPSLYINSNAFSSEMYCLLCALCAATIVQLDASIPQPAPLHPTKATDDLFAEECLRERRCFDYIEPVTPLSVLSSFFLFAYYGNHEKHAKAWHYLQESITFAENLNMDNEEFYGKLDPVEAQWRRRLYWLLFITERAYAVQRRKHTRLHVSVQLPAVFESEDPQLLNGFVNLANLFSAVDESFVSAWRGSRRPSLCTENWLMNTQQQLDTAALALDNITETQHLDIAVTREWLHVLAWQMGVSNGLIWGKGEGGMRLDYPIELARKVVEITSGADEQALNSHGIGMEQKLSDIAGCLADVLKCTDGDTSSTFLEGKDYLHTLLRRLSSMRGKESRYLQPLMSKMEGLMGYELSTQTLPAPTEAVATRFPSHVQHPEFLATPLPRYSIADSMGMLRTLSMNGTLGMPGITTECQDEWQQRRPSGRVYDEAETNEMEPWLVNGTA